MDKQQISKIVDKLCKKYKTTNPFEICKEKDIQVIYKDMPEKLKGYTITKYRIKFIYINSKLCEEDQYFTCCHELGHIMLKHNDNVLFTLSNTFYVVNRTEKEANFFAILLALKKYDVDFFNMNLLHLSMLSKIDIDTLKNYYNF